MTRQCPNNLIQCGFKIEKNGGCRHMKCSKCNFEFCWDCGGKYQSYKHSVTGNCELLNLSRFSMCVVLFLMFLADLYHRFNF